MQRKALDAHAHQLLHGLEDLSLGHAKLRNAGLAHAGGAEVQLSAGIVAQADLLRHAAVGGQKRDVGDIVEVDVGVQTAGILVLLRRRLVGGEHDLIAGEAAGFGQHQLRQRRAVHAAALLLQNFQNEGVRAGLDGVVFAIVLIP